MRAPRGCCEQGAPWRPAPGLRGGRGSMPRHARIRRPARRGRRAGPTNHEVARSARGAGDEGSPEGSSGTSVRSLRSKARPPIGARRASTQASGGGWDMDGATRECASAASLLSGTGLGRPHAGALTHAGGKGRQPPMRPQAAPGPPHHHQAPQERAHRLRTGLNVSHGQGRRAAWHCERPGTHNQGHTTRQTTPHDQDTCRVCSPDDSQERVVGVGCVCAP